ncbi:MAG: hypothetical protein ACR2P2_22405, partial [Nakamurella sp.]
MPTTPGGGSMTDRSADDSDEPADAGAVTESGAATVRRGPTPGQRESVSTSSEISGSAVRPGDRIFRGLAAGAGGTLLVVMAAIAVFLVWKAWPAL